MAAIKEKDIEIVEVKKGTFRWQLKSSEGDVIVESGDFTDDYEKVESEDGKTKEKVKVFDGEKEARKAAEEAREAANSQPNPNPHHEGIEQPEAKEDEFITPEPEDDPNPHHSKIKADDPTPHAGGYEDEEEEK